MLRCIKKLIADYVGPFYTGKKYTIGDVTMTPYFIRMVVLEHYRNFSVPHTKEYENWHKWKDNCLIRPAILKTILIKDKYIQAYERYAKCLVRNNWYHYVFGGKYGGQTYKPLEL